MDLTADRRGGRWPLVVGSDLEIRAALRQALRDGSTTDPRVDSLLREWQHRWRTRRWLVPISVACYLLAVLWTDDPGLRVLIAVGATAILAGAWAAERSHRRLRHYRGLVAEEPPV